MTVFVVQENNRLDYAPAEEFGEVIFMTADEYQPLKNSLRNQAILSRVTECLDSFRPRSDYLLLTGNPILIGYVFHLAYCIEGYVRCLQWDRMHNSYRVVEFTSY